MASGRGIPHISADSCKGCGLCVFVCPESVLLLNGSKVNSSGYHPAAVKAVEKCTACISCALICPDTAITVERLSRKTEG